MLIVNYDSLKFKDCANIIILHNMLFLLHNYIGYGFFPLFIRK